MFLTDENANWQSGLLNNYDDCSLLEDSVESLIEEYEDSYA